MDPSSRIFSATQRPIWPIQIIDRGDFMLTAPRRLPNLDSGLAVTPSPYPSPRSNLDVRHRNELARVLEDGIVSDQELTDARDYLASVRAWAEQVAEEQPGEPARAARGVLNQASWYRAAVQEADGFVQVDAAIRRNDPSPINDLLRRGYDDAAYGSALNFAGRGLNPLIQQMGMADRATMAVILSRVTKLNALDERSVTQLRASLRSPIDRASFDQRYPTLMGETILV